uniref:NADH dehydrogenase [ubiquinone] 1 beta subcomplex subunit 5, mitochondrial n=1 Tax=Riptortus pedestris TaxID=329032 RepID=R4WDK6_RIPPE|nr:NADH-ubiquinone oxidoreductase sgdh subunit [Riptortus pedestris]
MAIWSCLRSNASKWSSILPQKGVSVSSLRSMSGGHEHRVMGITPSRFQWKKLKDLFHLYFTLGLVPVGLIIFYSNVYIGPAKLAEIPEGYTPKHWEYYKHPITRWLARYVYGNPQQEYEKYLHYLYEQDELMKIRALQKRVKGLIEEREDYHAFYYVPVDGKYYRIVRKDADELAEIAGFNPSKEGPQ